MDQRQMISAVVGAVAGLAFLFFLPQAVPAQEYSLRDLLKIALERSERVRIAEENVFIAEQGRKKAISALIPRATSFATYTAYDQAKLTSGVTPTSAPTVIQPSDLATWGVRLDQSFYMNMREWTALHLARLNITRSRYELQSVRDDYLLIVCGAYFDVMRAQKGLAIAEANLDRLTRYRDAAKTRLRVGEVTKTTLLRAEAELSGALSDRERTKNALELARDVLARVVGLERPFGVKEDTFEDPSLVPVESFQEQALRNRSELKSLEMQKQMAEAQIDYARGAYWPTIGLSAVYSGLDQVPAATTTNKESKYVGAAVNFPFFEGGLRVAEVNEAKARKRQAEMTFNDTLKAIKVEVQSAFLDLSTQKGVLKFVGDQVVFARDNYNAVAKQFEFGLANSLDVIDANNLLLSAERQMADAMYSYQLAILRLDRTTGMIQKTALKQ
ncbi:MAG: TolC family protein [Syntrophales bacterium]|nr:TolC family protein [Syntrophales bacterium]